MLGAGYAKRADEISLLRRTSSAAPGRDAFITHLPGLRRRLQLDFVVVDAENVAGGFGITEKIAGDLYDAGADCITLGQPRLGPAGGADLYRARTAPAPPGQLPAPQPCAGQGRLAL